MAVSLTPTSAVDIKEHIFGNETQNVHTLSNLAGISDIQRFLDVNFISLCH